MIETLLSVFQKTFLIMFNNTCYFSIFETPLDTIKCVSISFLNSRKMSQSSLILKILQDITNLDKTKQNSHILFNLNGKLHFIILWVGHYHIKVWVFNDDFMSNALLCYSCMILYRKTEAKGTSVFDLLFFLNCHRLISNLDVRFKLMAAFM